jgi:uncharacterized protein
VIFMDIKVSKPTPQQIKEAKQWPIWEKEPSTFPYSYDSEEKFFVLEGKATVKTPSGTASFGAGDFVVMPKGLKCTWTVTEKIRKHYHFG